MTLCIYIYNMNNVIKIIIIIFFIEIFILLFNFINGIYKYFLLREKDICNIYKSITEDNPYVLITGASSGQGRDFAIEFAKRGFNLFLIGSQNINKTKDLINNLYPNVTVKILIKDFSHAINPSFFNDIENEIRILNTKISICINNVAYRTGWIGFENMDTKNIYDTISVKPISYSIITKMIIPIFLERKKLGLKSCLINISAQCMYNTNFLGNIKTADISVPYLNVYEASNAYTYYFTNSIYKEYKDKFDILNITPGAVITENTQYLENTIFSITSKKFVSNIMKFIGNITGTTCGYWKHALSPYLINLFPFIKDKILYDVGKNIAIDFMDKNKKVIN
jgi:short-subunit dehydrogenase